MHTLIRLLATRVRMLPWGLALAMSGLQVPQAAAQTAYPAHTVEAVFLYRFAGYVQWPSSVMAAREFTIAVIGAPDVATQLAQLLPDHPVQGKPARVRSISGADQLGDAQMLYIGPAYHGDIRALIAAIGNRPVLIVTDAPDGLASGSAVNFLIEQQHVRFEVSLPAAKRDRLRISSDLLAVAVRVETGNLRPAPTSDLWALLLKVGQRPSI